MKIKYNSEMISGAIFTIIALILLTLVPKEIKTLETTYINAQTVPKIALGGLAIFSFLLFLQGIIFIPKKEIVITKGYFKEDQFKQSFRSLIYILIIVFYVILFRLFGFIVSNLYLIFSVLFYYKAKKVSYYLIAISISTVVYLLFTTVLHISLP